MAPQECGKIRSWEHAPPSLQMNRGGMARGLFPAITLSKGGTAVFDLECSHTQDTGLLAPPPEWVSTCRPLASAWHAPENEYDLSMAPRERQAELTGKYADYWHLLPCRTSSAEQLLSNGNHLNLSNLRLDDNGADEVCDLIVMLARSERTTDSNQPKPAKATQRSRGQYRKVDNSEMQLNLRHNNLAALGQLPTVLQTLDVLTHMNLSYNSINDQGAEGLAMVIEHATCLITLDISHNHIGDKGILPMIEALKINSSILCFNVMHNRFSGAALVGLEELFAKTQTLKRVELGSNQLGDMGVDAVARGLTETHSLDTTTRVNVIGVDLSSSGVTAQGWARLADALKYNMSLEDINLGGNRVDDASASLLASKGFSLNPSLKSVDFARNSIGDEGCAALASELLVKEPVRSSLQELSLCRNSVGVAGARALASALRSNKALRVLDLGWCDVGNAGVVALGSAFHFNKNLRVLRLAHVGVGNAGALALFNDLSFSTTTQLEELDLRFNRIGGEGWESGVLAELVRATKSIRIINLGNNTIGSNEAFEVSRMLALDECVVNKVELLGNPISAESRARIVDTVRERQARLATAAGAAGNDAGSSA